MFKTAILIAIFIPCTAAFAGVAPTTQLQRLEQRQSMIVMDAHAARAFGYLSMGPDPGGKTGDTVTPTTTTSQPSTDGAGGSSQSGGSTAPSGAASTKADPNTRPTSSSGTSKQ